jgi:6-phosphogluconolactonase (cycloisomerase 2 family)
MIRLDARAVRKRDPYRRVLDCSGGIDEICLIFFSMRIKVRRPLFALPLLALASACGGGGGSGPSPTYSVRGTVVGLSGSGLLLQNNGDSSTPVPASGSFQFSGLSRGAGYVISVAQQPSNPTQTCVVSNGNGVMGRQDVTDVEVRCETNSYRIGGNVSGLQGTGLVLRINGAGDLPVSSAGTFAFAQLVPSGATYTVTVATQPYSPSQRCEVANGSGQVGGSPVSGIAVTCANVYTVSGTVSGLAGKGLVLSNNGSDDLAVARDGQFSFATAQYLGTRYAVTVRSGPNAPVQTCAVANGSGTITGLVANVTVTCQTDRLAYVPNRLSSYISIFAIDGIDGRLKPVAASPYSHPDFVRIGAMAFSPSRTFAYVTDAGNLRLHRLGVDAVTGALTRLDAVSLGGGGSHEIAVDPLGRFVYVSNFDPGTVSAFAVDASTGSLTSVPGSPFALGGASRELVLDPAGRWLYVANQGLSRIHAFAVDPASGALTEVAGSPYALPNIAFSVALDPPGKVLYATAGVGVGLIYAFSSNASTGALTPIAGSPFGAVLTACSSTVDPLDRFVFTANSVGSLGSVSTFSKALDGSLVQISGSPVRAGESPCDVTVDPSGRFVYVANVNSANVSGYSIAPGTGALTPVPNSPTATGIAPEDIAIR